MTHETLSSLLEWHFQEMRELHNTKGVEYAEAGDTLARFKHAAKKYGVSPLVVCLMSYDKQMRAIENYVRTGKEESSEKIDGRIRDAQLYLSLLNALIEDERAASDKQQPLWEELPVLACCKCGVPTNGRVGNTPICEKCCSVHCTVCGTKLFANENGTCNACASS